MDNIETILSVLNSLLSHDPSIRIPGERYINNNELMPGFLPKLLEISLLRKVC